MLTVAEYVRSQGGGKTYGNGANRRPVWDGDSCGCPDDRCIGHHHDEDEECGCLRVALDEMHHLATVITKARREAANA